MILIDNHLLMKLEPKGLGDYRKRPCISHTFFQKIEAKNQRCGLSMDTSVFGHSFLY